MKKINFFKALFIYFFLVNMIFFAAPKPVVFVFIIDGLQTDAAKTAMANGAVNLKFFFDNGVRVKEAYCVSPAPLLMLPDSTLPWSTSSPPNVAMHTGTHIFESRQMDDIFLETRKANIKSVFSGGADNYKEFNSADYCLASSASTDSEVVKFGIDHFVNDNVRLIRLHIQKIRRNWDGPQCKTDPDSRYIKYLIYVDSLLGQVIDAIKKKNLWDSTYVIIASDHGMGITDQSNHPPSVISSWKPYMNFYGPGIKKGESIPYAEAPDIAILVDHLLNLEPLKGHTDPNVKSTISGTTGTLLTNIFEGNPAELNHPMLIKKYLERKNWKPSDDYGDYRLGLISLIEE